MSWEYFWRQWHNPPHYPFWERLRGAWKMGRAVYLIRRGPPYR